METKTQKEFVDTGFGFPVHLMNVRMVKVRGVWTPKIDYNAYARGVLHALAHKPAPLIGNEVTFIRQQFEMTLQEFAKQFHVSHPAVIKWERTEFRPTKMNWATEKDLRLFVLLKLDPEPKEFVGLYDELRTPSKKRHAPIRVDAMQVAA